MVVSIEASWLPEGFTAEQASPDRDEVIASLSFAPAEPRNVERVGGLRCFRASPVGLMFIHLFSDGPSAEPGEISMNRHESYEDNGELRAAVWARCGTLDLTAVAAGVEVEDLMRVIAGLTVRSKPI